MIVDIIGTGKSLVNYEWPADRIKWSVGSAYGGFTKHIDLYFCMHEGDPEKEINEAGIDTLNKTTFPLNEVIAEFDSHYFTNTISYMVAYAILKGATEINMHGIDLAPYSEYTFERPSIAFWVGIAKAKGVNVNWDMIEPHVIYGYTEKAMSMFLNVLDAHRESAEYHRDKEEDEAKHNQWTGYIAACNMIKRELQS